MDVNFSKWFYANACVSWQRGREELDNGKTSPSRHAAPIFGRVAVGHKCKRLVIEAFTAFQAECSAENMPQEEKEKTEFYALDADGNVYSLGWITLNLRASYRFAKALSINATFENITDTDATAHTVAVSAHQDGT